MLGKETELQFYRGKAHACLVSHWVSDAYESAQHAPDIP